MRSRPKLSRARGLALASAFPCWPPAAPAASLRFDCFDAVAQQVEDFLADVFQLEAEVHQDLGRDPFLLAEEAQQEVLGPDVVVVEVAGLFHRVLDDLLGPRRLRQLAHDDQDVRSGLDDLLDLETDLAEIDVEVLEDVGRDPEPSLTRPRRMCSVPMYSWLNRCALPGWPAA